MRISGLLALLVASAFTVPAHAQGGGASSTGTIQGRISDPQGALLAGVTVTATSPSALGAQTTISSETGNYRFPAIPPGTFELTYALAGFKTLKRTGIINTLGFTTNLNVALALATVGETVTVHGNSPIIDTSATSVVQVFKLDQLQSIPGRDMWALLAATPGVGIARIDVGGNRAGQQTNYAAYGYTGQVRVLVDGINTTEGTGAAGFYADYASLEEVFIGVQGQSAEMPNPGVQYQSIAKSGGNRFSGEYYGDFNNNAMQASNIPDDVIAAGIREHSNEMEKYYDTSISAGGAIKRDRLWWFGSYRRQKVSVAQPQFQFDQTSDLTLWNPVAKGTWQINQKNKLIGYYQWGSKGQPNRLLFGTYTHPTPEETFTQTSGAWVYKGEWIGTLSDKLYVEARYGDFGYYFPLVANSDEQYFWRDTGLQTLIGAGRKTQLDRDRKQWTGAATYFLDTARGSHTVKFGAELLKEQSWEGTLQQWGGNIEHQYANGVSSTVVFGLPTATKINSLSANDEGGLTARAALDHAGVFVNDTWAVGRFTVIGGLRLDRYRGWLPEQHQLAASVGPVSVAAKTFPEKEFYTWNQVAPRFGVVYDLSGDGRMVVKANYGFYWHNPGIGVSNNGNPNTAFKSATYTWNDRNGDRRWQPGEESAAPTSAALEGTVGVDPSITAPYTHDAGVFVERQIGETLGLRTGFVYKTDDDLIANYQPGRSVLNGAFSVPFPFVDVGVDGVRGTNDDRTLTLYGMPTAQAANFPADSVVTNVPRYGRYKTVELSVHKRHSNKLSFQVGSGYTWTTDFPQGFPINPNEPGVYDRTGWGVKASGTYDAPYGIRLSPVFRHQSGVNFARQISVPANAATAFGLILPTSIVYADSADANREENVWLLDIRAEKTVSLTDRMRAHLILDLFNITNSHKSELLTRTTGANYLRPGNIMAPFTMRVGFRIVW
jgi:hypothetical protein